jgi:hypothetical protein
MSEGPREREFNFEAADEVALQAERAKGILERLAAHLAATSPQRDPYFLDLVEREHVIQAAELLFGQVKALLDDPPLPPRFVFVSFSHEDEAFVGELADKLIAEGISFFKADRDIQPATDWDEEIWAAIRRCRVFLPILTPRFVKSRWCDLEGGAARVSGKKVLPVLRYVDRKDVGAPFSRFQSMIVENNEQLRQLIEALQRMCQE